MNFALIIILLVRLVSIRATRYDCDQKGISCGCGFKNVDINEQSNNPEEAIPYSWSMMVSVRYDCTRNGDPHTHCCSGIILNDRHILTTTRCFNSTVFNPDNMTIAASIHSLSQNCPSVRAVEEVFVHPDWTPANETIHNIVILRLVEPLDFRADFIFRQACLPSPMNGSIEIESDATLAVVGWRVLDNSSDNTDKVIQQLIARRLDSNDSLCARSVDDNDAVLCAGRDGASCFPEIGTALFQWVGNHWELVGIDSSAIDGCSGAGYRGLFVRVAAYTNWIEPIINLNSLTTTPITPTYTYKCNRTISCGCGYDDVAFRPTRIVGGENALDASWSMIVSLRFFASEEHTCAGTLLSNSFVLTAAHCVDYFRSTYPINITIDAGITNRSDTNRYQRNVERIYIHPNYTGWPLFLNNIALLKVDRPFIFQNNPILTKTCVHRSNSSIPTDEQRPKNGTRLVVIGWGAMRPGSFVLSDYLKQIQIQVIDHRDELCKNVSSNDEIQFCAGTYYGEKDACLGDSGGPILYWTGHYWEQVGVIGYNFYCGRPDYPGVYTRLSYYWQWMEDILNLEREYLEPQNPSPFPTTTTSTRSTTTRTTTRRSTTTASATFSEPTDITYTMQSIMSTVSNTSETQIGANTTTIQPLTMTTSFTQITANTTTTQSTSMINNATKTGTTMTTSGTQTVGNTSTIQTTTMNANGTQIISNTTIMQPTTMTTDGIQRVNTTITQATTITASGTQSETTTTANGTQTETITTANGTRTVTNTTTLQPATMTSIGTQIVSNSTTMQLTTTLSSGTQIAANTTIIQPTTMIMNVTQILANTSTIQPTTTTASGTQIALNTTFMQPTTTITSRTQVVANSSTIQSTTMISNATQGGTNTTSRQTTIAMIKETYKCNRIPDECGCSMNDVVLSHDNQQSSSTNRIGEDAYPYSWSMIVSIGINATKYICVGTILSDSFILTAAHCVANQSNNTIITVAAGIHGLSQYSTSDRRVDQVHIHESYTATMPHLHDIAILHLEKPLEIKTQPVFSKTCVSNLEPFDSAEVSPLVSVGWKHWNVDENEENNVQQVSIKSLSSRNSTCYSSIYYNTYQFCAGSLTNDACRESFGEPVFIFKNRYWEQVGILSQSYGCIPTGHSGVYIRLSAYTNWMQLIMQNTTIPVRTPMRPNGGSKLQQTLFFLILLPFNFYI